MQDWIDNSMIFLEVEDVDQFWNELLALDLTAKYKNVRLTPIRKLDWGNECFLHDPSGIIWHFGEFSTVNIHRINAIQTAEMKTMTCIQLGGACDTEFHANSFEEMAELSKKHGMEMFQKGDKDHLEAMNKMKEIMKTRMQ